MIRGNAMGFTDAIKSGFANYVNFSGRAVRSEYWYWVLFVVIVSVVARVIDTVLFGGMAAQGIAPVADIIGLALLLPGLAVGARRLHDTDRSSWWMAAPLGFFIAGSVLVFVIGPIALIFSVLGLICAIVLIVWMCQPGTPGSNTYGSPRMGDTAALQRVFS
jgi:uncharacterized membrane protein YhaH (DUF805 family)